MTGTRLLPHRLVRTGYVLALVAALVAPAAPAARAATCPDLPIRDRLDAADVAFVGRVVARLPVASAAGVARYDYRFVVFQEVKGRVGRRATVRAAELRDVNGLPLTPASEVDVGVLATRAGERLVTSTCGLVDAGSLLGVADEPKGGAIKVGIGVVLLGLVLAYSLVRLRRRDRVRREA